MRFSLVLLTEGKRDNFRSSIRIMNRSSNDSTEVREYFRICRVAVWAAAKDIRAQVYRCSSGNTKSFS